MNIYLGADHRGFNLKEAIKKRLTISGYAIVDLGNAEYDKNDDFPDYAQAVARKVAKDKDGVGIVVCGSGFGVDIAANRFPGVRAALAMSPEHMAAGRHDDNVNVLALAADFMDEMKAFALIEKFLSVKFEGDERYVRRIAKIDKA